MASRARSRRGARRALHLICAATLTAATGLVAAAVADGDEPERFAYSTALAGVIDHSSERALDRTIDDARDKGADVLIVRLDTPGGQATATRAMIRDILAAPMPVIMYVHPRGGRADSAGMFMMLAADVAAMAPATNIGSATPVRPPIETDSPSDERILRDLDRKFLNSSAAFARTLAEERGRNADLAERMVRVAENVTAGRARRERLVDVVAPSEPALLRAIDGFQVKGRKAQRLRSAGLPIRRVQLARLDIAADDVDGSSLWRSLVLVSAVAMTLGLVGVVALRGPRRYRRWKRRRRARARRNA